MSNEALELWLNDNWFSIELALEAIDMEATAEPQLAEAARANNVTHDDSGILPAPPVTPGVKRHRTRMTGRAAHRLCHA